MNVKDMLKTLENFWYSQGVNISYSYDVETGAGTAHPNTFLKALGPLKESFAYLQPCRRPQDGRYGDNPNRLYQHHQFQIFIKPAPNNIEELYLKSLEAIGIDLKRDDVRFLEDNWKQPTLGAWGLGSEVRINGREVTQFTYFNQIGNIDLDLIPIEIAIGVERLALAVQKKDNILDLDWDSDKKYGDVFHQREYDLSKYTFEVANSKNYFTLFDIYIDEANRALEASLVNSAYDMVLKASHAFNILDAQKSISQKERQNYILKVSKAAKRKTYEPPIAAIPIINVIYLSLLKFF